MNSVAPIQRRAVNRSLAPIHSLLAARTDWIGWGHCAMDDLETSIKIMPTDNLPGRQGTMPYQFKQPKVESVWDAPLVIPIAIAIVFSLVARYTPLDLWFAGLLYNSSLQCFPGDQSEALRLIWRVGPWLGHFVWVVGLIQIYSATTGILNENWRFRGLIPVLVAALGAGIIVNLALKDFISRPRPKQLIQFGGTEEFVRLGDRGPNRPHLSSFPSGHAAIGFAWISPAFCVRRKRLAHRWMGVGICFGLLMGLIRMAQGGHFLSDVVWSGLIIYFVAYAAQRALLTVIPEPVAVPLRPR